MFNYVNRTTGCHCVDQLLNRKRFFEKILIAECTEAFDVAGQNKITPA